MPNKDIAKKSLKKAVIIFLTTASALTVLIYLAVVNGWLGWLGKEYMPRSSCMFGEQGLINSHIWADTIISVSYATLPIWLVIVAARRKDLMHKTMYVIFAGFILFCGMTHIMNIIAIWHTYYRLDAVIKWLCAISSAGAAISFPFVIYAVIKAPTPKQFAKMAEELRMARQVLEEANQKTQSSDNE